MNDLEKTLQRLRLRQPSAELDRRITATLSQRSRARRPIRRAISFQWAMLIIIATSILAFIAGRLSNLPDHKASSKMTASPASSIILYVDYKGSSNPFDCTTVSDDGLQPATSVKSSINPGV